MVSHTAKSEFHRSAGIAQFIECVTRLDDEVSHYVAIAPSCRYRERCCAKSPCRTRACSRPLCSRRPYPQAGCSRRPCSSLAMFQVAQSGGQETRRGLRCRGRSSTYAFHHDVEGTRMTPTCHGEKSLGLRSLLLTVGSDVMANRSFYATSSRSFVAGEADRQAGNREWPADGRSGRREVPSRARACRAGRASPRALIARDLVGTNKDLARTMISRISAHETPEASQLRCLGGVMQPDRGTTALGPATSVRGQA